MKLVMTSYRISLRSPGKGNRCPKNLKRWRSVMKSLAASLDMSISDNPS